MNTIRASLKRVVLVIAVIALVLTAGGVVTLRAQAANPLDVIVAKLDQILAALAPPSRVKIATSTSYLTFAYTVWCSIANTGSESLQDVRITFVTGQGSVVTEVETPSLAAGRTLERLFVGPPISERSRCEFTYTGPASAGRANMHVVSGDVMFVYEAR